MDAQLFDPIPVPAVFVLFAIVNYALTGLTDVRQTVQLNV
jgi:hypothetical protein